MGAHNVRGVALSTVIVEFQALCNMLAASVLKTCPQGVWFCCVLCVVCVYLPTEVVEGLKYHIFQATGTV